MPNWCENEVEITFADTAEQHKFLEQVGDLDAYIGWGDDKPQLFDKFLPTPPELMEGEGWWAWRIGNWGTKWNPQIDDFRDEGDVIVLRMNTAWSPPREFFRTFSTMFPSATIELAYLEEGMAFCGKSTFVQGEDIDERYINNIPSAMYEAVGYKLDADGHIDWENSEDTTSLWNIIEDDDQFNKYYEMERV